MYNYYYIKAWNQTALYLQSEQQKEGLHAVETSVHKVAHEEIVCLWNISAHLQTEGD